MNEKKLVPIAYCSFCDEEHVVKKSKQLQSCPNCLKPMKLLKKDKWRKVK